MQWKLIGIACALACAGAWAQDTMGRIEVTSSTIQANAAIPKKHSAYYDGVSPALAWTRVEGAKSYALIMDDPDAHSPAPFVHWVAYNIPAGAMSLAEGATTGLVAGKSGKGNTGYYGPRPPPPDGPHHYHFRVMALDTMLDLPAGADKDALLKAAEGHVIAKGELVGTYDQDEKPAK